MLFSKRLMIFTASTFLFAQLMTFSPSAISENAAAYTDDTVITTKVKTALLHTAGLKSAAITVETYKGVVKLSGFIDSKTEIEKAVDVTKHVKGVKSVENALSVKCS